MLYCRVDNGKELVCVAIECSLQEARELVDMGRVFFGRYYSACYVVYL